MVLEIHQYSRVKNELEHTKFLGQSQDTSRSERYKHQQIHQECQNKVSPWSKCCLPLLHRWAMGLKLKEIQPSQGHHTPALMQCSQQHGPCSTDPQDVFTVAWIPFCRSSEGHLVTMGLGRQSTLIPPGNTIKVISDIAIQGV